ncbi:hypothetical protein CONLIGDRAFT_702532 [Coniochaeta ligniaria NRRL 30616]|uniref:CFEM domain-containing protein n=1 Tax=Coniochaeta ligniaria NRRL 30616 TaxID=1408157 RepID=A0A1J7JJS0_9PEZI|nr:hypothetical protein CONLIGDRAFT_702532 [Coniochaeta ligniaria NRRL 30616]
MASSPSLPVCAVSCVGPAATAIGCSSTDASCICSKETDFGNAISSCLIEACSASDISAATTALAQLCDGASAPGPTSSTASSASSISLVTVSTGDGIFPITGSSASRTPTSTTSSTATGAGIGTAADTTSPSSSATTQPGAPSSSTATPTPGASPSGLSTGAIAGIAVGAVLGVLLLALAAFLVWRRSRRARAVASTHDDGGLAGPHELPAAGHDSNAKYGMSPPSELLAPNAEKKQALEHELPADPTGPQPVGLQSSSPSHDSYFGGRGTNNAELDGNPVVSAAPNPHPDTAPSPGQQVEEEQSPPFGSSSSAQHPTGAASPGSTMATTQYSDAPEVVEPDPNEISYILARAAELEAQRRTLLHLWSVEEEQEAQRARLAMLQQGNR